MAAKVKPARAPRARARVVTFVKPQLMHHEALALIDYVRNCLAGATETSETLMVRQALDEVVRAANEYVVGRR